jgi:hypothetical protein
VIASKIPLKTPTPDEFISRLPETARADLLEAAIGTDSRMNLHDLVSRILAVELRMNELPRNAPDVRITDDLPFNEYFLLRRQLGWYQDTTNPLPMRGLTIDERRRIHLGVVSGRSFLNRYLKSNKFIDIHPEMLTTAVRNWMNDPDSHKPSKEKVAFNLACLFGQHVNKTLHTNWVIAKKTGMAGLLVIRHNKSGIMIAPMEGILSGINAGRVVNFKKTYRTLENRLKAYHG